MRELKGIAIVKCAIFAIVAIIWCAAPNIAEIVPFVCLMWGIALLNLFKSISYGCHLFEKVKIILGIILLLIEFVVLASMLTACFFIDLITLADIPGVMLFIFIIFSCIYESILLLKVIYKNIG